MEFGCVRGVCQHTITLCAGRVSLAQSDYDAAAAMARFLPRRPSRGDRASGSREAVLGATGLRRWGGGNSRDPTDYRFQRRLRVAPRSEHVSRSATATGPSHQADRACLSGHRIRSLLRRPTSHSCSIAGGDPDDVLPMRLVSIELVPLQQERERLPDRCARAVARPQHMWRALRERLVEGGASRFRQKPTAAPGGQGDPTATSAASMMADSVEA